MTSRSASSTLNPRYAIGRKSSNNRSKRSVRPAGGFAERIGSLALHDRPVVVSAATGRPADELGGSPVSVRSALPRHRTPRLRLPSDRSRLIDHGQILRDVENRPELGELGRLELRQLLEQTQQLRTGVRRASGAQQGGTVDRLPHESVTDEIENLDARHGDAGRIRRRGEFFCQYHPVSVRASGSHPLSSALQSQEAAGAHHIGRILNAR